MLNETLRPSRMMLWLFVWNKYNWDKLNPTLRFNTVLIKRKKVFTQCSFYLSRIDMIK